jgi:DNA-binding transcriptional ArsR family regulator
VVDPARQIEELDAVLGALAHPARRQILLTIWFRGGEMGSGDIAARFRHSWPTTTRHLRVLEEAGLVTQEKQGRTRVYRVNRDKLTGVREWLAWFDPKPQEGP